MTLCSLEAANPNLVRVQYYSRLKVLCYIDLHWNNYKGRVKPGAFYYMWKLISKLKNTLMKT